MTYTPFLLHYFITTTLKPLRIMAMYLRQDLTPMPQPTPRIEISRTIQDNKGNLVRFSIVPKELFSPELQEKYSSWLNDFALVVQSSTNAMIGGIPDASYIKRMEMPKLSRQEIAMVIVLPGNHQMLVFSQRQATRLEQLVDWYRKEKYPSEKEAHVQRDNA